MTIQITRAKELPPVEAEVIRQIYLMVKGRYSDSKWHKFKEKLQIRDHMVEVECEFMCDGMLFSLKKPPERRILLPH